MKRTLFLLWIAGCVYAQPEGALAGLAGGLLMPVFLFVLVWLLLFFKRPMP